MSRDLTPQLPMLRRIARRYARLSCWGADANELLHEAVLDILEHLERFDASRGSFTAFCRVWGLHGVRQAVARRCRHTARAIAGDADELPTSAPELEIEEALDLANALELLPERARRIIVLRFAYGLKQREIGSLMKTDRQHAERSERAARRRLAAHVRNVEGGQRWKGI